LSSRQLVAVNKMMSPIIVCESSDSDEVLDRPGRFLTSWNYDAELYYENGDNMTVSLLISIKVDSSLILNKALTFNEMKPDSLYRRDL